MISVNEFISSAQAGVGIAVPRRSKAAMIGIPAMRGPKSWEEEESAAIVGYPYTRMRSPRAEALSEPSLHVISQ